jgi:esterase/lipase superfamily enzyme
VRLAKTDRWLWVVLSRISSGWRTALVILRPETVIAWHRRGLPIMVVSFATTLSVGYPWFFDLTREAIRIRTNRGIRERATQRMYKWLDEALTTLQETKNLARAAGTAALLVEVNLEDVDVDNASRYLALAISLATDGGADAVLLDRLLGLQQRVAEATDQKLLDEQKHAGAALAKRSLETIRSGLAHVPFPLLDELVRYVDAGAIDGGRRYSMREFMQAYRRRGTAYFSEPPPDPELAVFDRVDDLRGDELLRFATAFRDAATSPLGYAIIPVYFATDRVRTDGNRLAEYFAGGREPGVRPSLSYGVAFVSIPRDHRMGLVERPKFWRLERTARPDKHVMLLSIKSYARKDFLAAVDSALHAEANQTALLFIHGYRVTFADAITRTAQVCYDLNWTGIPIAYSWSSHGELKHYIADEASADATVPMLREILESLVRAKHMSLLHAVCHSMGARIFSKAIAGLPANRKAKAPAVNEVVLSAPDIDAQEFGNLAPAMRARCDRLTLYASSKDLALAASRKLHDFPRAGESGPNIVVLPELLDTIDATAVDTNLIGHSYYGDNSSIIADIYSVMTERKSPPRFGLRPEDSTRGRYWRFQP